MLRHHPVPLEGAQELRLDVLYLHNNTLEQGRTLQSPSSTSPRTSSPYAVVCRYSDPETAAGTPVIAYIDDEPFLPEQPDAGAQELDATVDNDSYYTGGAYYYVQAADDDQE
ncbi:uncharacterized protein [Aegilops tauschii subsp. strangulata]|uniref:uncharacterized protein n=1 Tax=Aegilops tauschii subsp. strangulata TaxID=200361 RepID=UPI001ABC59CC|nr:uncharacterized protein LOC120964461 isoform X2 [Aegilops tauschii subsp. strangulata]